MAKPGPQPVDVEQLQVQATWLYHEFLELSGEAVPFRFDRAKYERLKKVRADLTGKEKTKFEEREEMIGNGRLTPAQREAKFRRLERDVALARDLRACDLAYSSSRTKAERRAKPEAIQNLLEATKPEQVHEICNTLLGPVKYRVFDPRTLKSLKKRLTVYGDFSETISYYAEQFIAAKNHARYPHGRVRNSTMKERLWFLSRAIAGAAHERDIGTAIRLLGSKRPEPTHGL
jgi:hypothetical protein